MEPTEEMVNQNGPEQADRAALSVRQPQLINNACINNYRHAYDPVYGTVDLHERPDPIEPHSAAASMGTAFMYGVGLAAGFTRRVASGVKKVSVGTGAIQVEFGIPSMFEDSLYIEYVETRNLWRSAQYRSDIELRPVQASELTQGFKDLINLAGCSFKTSARTPSKKKRPIEVPLRSLRYVTRTLGFDIAHKGILDIVHGTRFGRHIKAALVISAMADPFGNDYCTGPLEIDVEDHVLKTCINVSVTNNVSHVVHEVKSKYKNTLFTEHARKRVHRKLRSKNGYKLLV